MNNNFRILIAEDLPTDADLAEREILKALPKATFLRVETEEAFKNALDTFKPDLIVSDYQMPSFDGMRALRITQEKTPHIPLIIHTGSMNEDTAVECMKAGATDYVIKEHIKRLGPAVTRALELKVIKADKEQTQQALVESEERFRRLAENAEDLIYRYEFMPEKRFSYVSPSALKITGYTPEEHYADPDLGYKVVHPDDIHLLEELSGDSGSVDKPLTLRWIKKDGQIYWVEQRNVRIFDDNGNLIAIEGIARDITERLKAEETIRRNEQLLQIAGNLAQLGGWSVNLEEHNVIWSDQVAAIHEMPAGYSPTVEEGISFYAPESRDRIIKIFTACATNGIPYDEELQILTSTGKRVWVRTIGVAERDVKDKIIRVNGGFQDISERKFFEQSLEKKSENLSMLLEVGQTLSASHTLKEVISNIVSGAVKIPAIGSAAIYLIKGSRIKLEATFPALPDDIPDEFRIAKLVDHPHINKAITAKRFVIVNDAAKADFTEPERSIAKLIGLQSVLFAPMVYKDQVTGVLIVGSTEQKHEFTADEADVYRILSNQAALEIEEARLFEEKSKVVEKLRREVRQRQRALEALKASEEKFRCLVQGSKDIIAMYDAQGKVLYKSPGIKSILGYEPDEVVGMSAFDMVYDDDKAVAYNHLKQLLELPKGETIRFQIRALHKNGTIRWFDAAITNMLHEKGVKAFVGNYRDITHEHRAELIQQTQYNIAQAFIIANDLDELLAAINTELSSVLDTKNFVIAFYDEASNMLSAKHGKDELSEAPLLWPATDSLSGMVIREKKTIFLTKREIKKLADKGEIVLRGARAEIWLGIPIMNENRINGLIILQNYHNPEAFNHTDIKMLEIIANELSIFIEKKKQEEDLLIAKEKAEESDRLKTAFLNNISHEVRTPLNGILGFTNLLNEGDTTPEERDYYSRIINQSGQQLLSIIDDMINIATIESGQERLNETETNLKRIFDSVFIYFRKRLNVTRVLLNYQVNLSDEQACIVADETKIRQILSNLLGNAVKYTDKGRIEFSCKIQNGFLLLCVEDTGIGIPETYHELIFERFRQVDHGPSRLSEGNGLGLAISKAYVELMGGEIWVESEPDKGSKFYFTIPYRPVKLADQELERIGEKSDLTDTGGLKKKKILLAEDEYSNYMLVEIFLQPYGVNIVHVTNGKDAIEQFRKSPDIDLVLMDLKMPVVSGFDATRIIKQERPEIPVIALTAYALSGDRERALAAGCDDYLAKPIKKNDLLALINKYS